MNFNIECEQELDGRWLAEIPQLPGVIVYGNSANEAIVKAEILALKVLIERFEQNELCPTDIMIALPIAA